MKRMGISVNIMQRMIERKLNFYGHICWMPDDRLIKQVCFRHNGWQEQERKTEKKMDRRQGYQHPLRIGDGQEEMDTFLEICHGHQRALSPWSKKRERAS